eukprot:1142625-Pelagomonas_calceolata.AAC.1
MAHELIRTSHLHLQRLKLKGQGNEGRGKLNVALNNPGLNIGAPHAIQLHMCSYFAHAHPYRDCIGIAKTGSGKTLAFVLPMLRHIKDQPPLMQGDGPIGLIMAPTRELVQQISKVKLPSNIEKTTVHCPCSDLKLILHHRYQRWRWAAASAAAAAAAAPDCPMVLGAAALQPTTSPLPLQLGTAQTPTCAGWQR